MRHRHVLAACAFALAPLAASAVVLDGPSVVTRDSAVTPTGPQQALALRQPGLGLTAGVLARSSDFNAIGQVRFFAFNFMPRGFVRADGQELAVVSEQALFSKIGFSSGGNDRTTFATPDLSGRSPVGAGGRFALGETFGAEATTITSENLPRHDHDVFADALRPGGLGFLPIPSAVAAEGESDPASISVAQPSTALNFVVPTTGFFPSSSGSTLTPTSSGATSTLGFVEMTAEISPLFRSGGGAAVAADGALLAPADNSALFSLIGGGAFGGDNVNTFGVPDLVDSTPIGVGAGPGLPQVARGQQVGADGVTLTESTLASHGHDAPGITPADAPAGQIAEFTSVFPILGFAGSGSDIDLRQPSLGLNWIIATEGLFPSRAILAGDGVGAHDVFDQPLLGEMALFAGNFAPTGWAFADGALLDILNNQSLFSLLGTTFGGDGRTAFGLPDLRGRAAVGLGGGVQLGQSLGALSTTLSAAQLPAHSHTVSVDLASVLAPIPLPAPAWMLLAGVGGLAVFGRRARSPRPRR